MLGLRQISNFLPQEKLCNYDFKDKFSIDEIFIKEKIGFEYLTRKQKDEKASNLCIKAYEKLVDVDKNAIDCIVLITQNGDFKIPHTSAILQDKLNLAKNCACFDINLACSGYIYGLCAILGFMQINGFTQGLLFTCDPYSQIINDDDKNTALLFGDAASVSLINTEPIYVPKAFKFGTDGAGFEAIFCQKDRLSMDGRAVFNFAMQIISSHIEQFLQENSLSKEQIDKFLFHQGSKFIINSLAKRLGLDESKMPFLAKNYGNTISSSIPLMLQPQLLEQNAKRILACGFGGGLSWGSCILEKFQKEQK